MRAGFFQRLSAALKAFTQPGEASKPEGFELYQADDPEMRLAIERAKATLHRFWASFEANDGRDETHLLKAGLSTPAEAIEHVWLEVSGRQDGRVTGILTVDPVDLPDVSIGDEIIFVEDRISDWAFVRDGELHGSFTMRVMHLRVPPDRRGDIPPFAPLPPECDVH